MGGRDGVLGWGRVVLQRGPRWSRRAVGLELDVYIPALTLRECTSAVSSLGPAGRELQ